MALSNCRRTSFCATAIVVAALLSSAAFLATVSVAEADQLTYDIIPFSYADNAIDAPPRTDTITGTIMVSSAGSILNTYTAGDPSNSAITVTSNLIVTSSDPGVLQVTASGSKTLDNLLLTGEIQFSATELNLFSDTTLTINNQPEGYFTPYVDANWAPHDNAFVASAGLNNYYASTMQFYDANTSGNFVDGHWTIAQVVPEPSSLAMLSLFLAVAGVPFLRSRWAKG